MKFDIKKFREIVPQLLGETNKAYRERALRNQLQNLIGTLEGIQGFDEFDFSQEYNRRKKKKWRFIIDIKGR